MRETPVPFQEGTESRAPSLGGAPASVPAAGLEVDLEFQDWGLIPYQDALDRMLELVPKVADGLHPGTLIFCSHPPVITRGRATQPGDVFAWDGPQLEVSRGGRATYHGPSQLVVYPVLSLKDARKGRAPQEIAGYLRALENAIVDTLAEDGIAAVGKSLKKKSADLAAADETGVWVGERKIASLGIGVKRWVAYHGAAINLDHDPKAFTGLNPCGFRTGVMTSLQEILGKPIDRADFAARLKTRLLQEL